MCSVLSDEPVCLQPHRPAWRQEARLTKNAQTPGQQIMLPGVVVVEHINSDNEAERLHEPEAITVSL